MFKKFLMRFLKEDVNKIVNEHIEAIQTWWFNKFEEQRKELEEANKYLKAERTMNKRLMKLLVSSLENPGESITEDMRKAEKWNKTLKKRFRNHMKGVTK